MTRLTRKINKALNAVEEGVNRPLNPSRRRRNTGRRRRRRGQRPRIPRRSRAYRRTARALGRRAVIPLSEAARIRQEYARGTELTPSAQVVTGGPMVPPALTRPRRVAGSELAGRLLGTRRVSRARVRVGEEGDTRFLQTLDPIFWTGTRTQKIAQTYMSLRINSFSIEYVPSASSLVTGTVYLAFFRANDLDWTPAGLTAALSSGSARVNQQFMVHMDPTYLQNRRQEFDVRDILSFPVAVAYVEGASSSDVYGHIRLHYSYSFTSPSSEDLVYSSYNATISDALTLSTKGEAPIAAFLEDSATEAVKNLRACMCKSGASEAVSDRFTEKLKLGKVLTFKIQPTGLLEISCDGYTSLLNPEQASSLEDLPITLFTEGTALDTTTPVVLHPQLEVYAGKILTSITDNISTTRNGMILISTQTGSGRFVSFGNTVTTPTNYFTPDDAVSIRRDSGEYLKADPVVKVLNTSISTTYSYLPQAGKWTYVEPGKTLAYSDIPDDYYYACLYYHRGDVNTRTSWQNTITVNPGNMEPVALYQSEALVLLILPVYRGDDYTSRPEGLRGVNWPFTVEPDSNVSQYYQTLDVNSYGFFYMPIKRFTTNYPCYYTSNGCVANTYIQPAGLNFQPIFTDFHTSGYTWCSNGIGAVQPAYVNVGQDTFNLSSQKINGTGGGATLSVTGQISASYFIWDLRCVYWNKTNFDQITNLPIFDGVKELQPDFFRRVYAPPTQLTGIHPLKRLMPELPAPQLRVREVPDDEDPQQEPNEAFELAGEPPNPPAPAGVRRRPRT